MESDNLFSNTYRIESNAPLADKLRPKNFHPVGVSKQGIFKARATKSTAELVGIDRATPAIPSLYPGTQFVLACLLYTSPSPRD